MFCKARHADELFERGFLHLLYMRKTHVIFDERENLLGIVVRKAQALANFLGHFHAYVYVAVKADAVGSDAKCRRLPNIMQQCAPCQDDRARLWQSVEQEQSVHEDIAFRMKLRRLLDTPHSLDFRENFSQQSRLV